MTRGSPSQRAATRRPSATVGRTRSVSSGPASLAVSALASCSRSAALIASPRVRTAPRLSSRRPRSKS